MKYQTKLSCWLLASIPVLMPAATLHVPADFPTIQNGIDTAITGDTVLVDIGIYFENINFNGKNIVVGSLFLTTNDTSLIEQTVINGNEMGSVVQFTDGEDSTALLTGFTIINGLGNPYGGGIYCANSAPRLENLVIADNTASSGGGIFISVASPYIKNVTVRGNNAASGGGIFCYVYSEPILENVVVNNNFAFTNGGGISMMYSDPVLNQVTISDNQSVQGSGIFSNNANFVITNSIVWNNFPEQIALSSGSAEITYSDIHGGWEGEGNINANPLFCDPFLFNYALAENSPCAGSGIAGANMGAMEVDCGQDTMFSGPVWHVSPAGSDLPGYGEESTPFASIQYAIYNAAAGDTVLASPGEYFENLSFFGKNIVVGSWFITTGDTSFIAQTTIDGRQITSVVNFDNGENATAVLAGFTITNGNGIYGGGIYCNQSSPTLKYLVIRDNQAISGAGIYCRTANPLLEHVTLVENSAVNLGGAIYGIEDSNPWLNSAILWNNEPQEIYFSSNGSLNSINILYSDIAGGQNNIVAGGNADINWLEGNINRDPVFCDPEYGSFGLAENSPCRNAGAHGSHMGALGVSCDTVLVDRSAWYVSVNGLDSLGGGSEAYPFSTIQFGINMAGDNDTVLIQPGTYYENINFYGGKIMLGSLFLSTGDTAFISQTIIDGGQNGSVVTFENDESNTTMLNGVTLTNGSAARGGAIYCRASGPSLFNLVIFDNQATYGGAIACDSASNPNLLNVTISNNYAQHGGGVYCEAAEPVLVNSILWNNQPQEIYFAASNDPNSMIIATSDIMGGNNDIVTNNNGIVTWLGSNLNIDPLFCNPDSGDYRLDAASPCRTAGATSEIIGALNVGCGVTVATQTETIIPSQFALLPNYPNPFNPVTTVRFDLPEMSFINLTIYDVLGKRIVTLINNNINAGYNNVVWDGKDRNNKPVPSGIYICKISATSQESRRQFSQSRKMLLIK